MLQGMYIRSCIHPFVVVHPSREHVSILLVGFWGPYCLSSYYLICQRWRLMAYTVNAGRFIDVFLGDDVLFCWGLCLWTLWLSLWGEVLLTAEWVLARSSLNLYFVPRQHASCYSNKIDYRSELLCTRHVSRKLTYVYVSLSWLARSLAICKEGRRMTAWIFLIQAWWWKDK